MLTFDWPSNVRCQGYHVTLALTFREYPRTLQVLLSTDGRRAMDFE